MRESGAAATITQAEAGYSTLVIPSHNPSDFYAKGIFDNASPSPVALFSNFLPEAEPLADSKSFWNSFAGILPSPTPLTNARDHTLLTNAVSTAETVAWDGDLTVGNVNVQKQAFPGSNAKYKSMMPSRLPISAKFTCLTIPPGLSPATLLESPVVPNVKPVGVSPTNGCLGSALETELIRSSAIAEGGEHNEVIRRQQGSFGSACCSDDGAMVFKPVSDTFESTHLPATSLNLEMTEQEPTFLQNGAQVNNSAQRNTFVASDSDGFTIAQLSDITPHCFNDRTTIDGYNWKKYGQKQLKNTEFPRSYYKCTYPNCSVKKQVECSHDGEITEIMYKGEHNHPKPHGPRRGGKTGGQSFLNDNHNVEAASAVSKQECDQVSADFSSSSLVGLSGTPEQSFGSPSMGEVDNFEHVKSEDEGEVEQDSKRRRTEKLDIYPNAPVRTRRDPRVVVQTTSNIDVLDDGYRWRKYGQKVVKGKVFPRSYYKCTNPGCTVRKHVERSSTDPTSVMTAYEGKHNHNVPAARGTVRETVGATAHSLPFAAPYANLGFSSGQRPPILQKTEEPGMVLDNCFNGVEKWDVTQIVPKMETIDGDTIDPSNLTGQSMGRDRTLLRHLDVGGMHRQGLGSKYSQPLYASTVSSYVTQGHILGT